MELREARVSAGLTLSQVASTVGITRQYLARIERGLVRNVSLPLLARLFAVVGMRLSARPYPAGLPLRDAGHLALLRRFQAILPDGLRMRTEVPIAGLGDRAWDAQVYPGARHANLEAETKLHDVQAVDRRVALKQASDPGAPVILLVADTLGNRNALAAARTLLKDRYPLETRQVLLALRRGDCPSASGIVVL